MADLDLGRMMTNVPIPGQGLTQAPANKLPIERPPQLTEINAAVSEIFSDLFSREKLPSLTRLLKEESIFIDRVASAYIEQGLIDGKWNTDMAHLLVEPVIFIFMWIASQVGAPVKFKANPMFTSSGVDVLDEANEEQTEAKVASLLTP